MKKRKLRILLIAEAANPEWVSVPLVGWNIAFALREHADVHIITQVRNRAAFMRRGLIEGKDFTAIDSEAIAAPFYRFSEKVRGGKGKGWTTLTALQSLSYPFFERLIWQSFKEAIKDKKYDVVHRITPLSPTAPSGLANRCRNAGVPFLLGPLNGGLPWHPEFSRERKKEKEWLSYIRQAYSLLPSVRSTYQNASAVIAGSCHTRDELCRYKTPIIYIPENGIDVERFKPQQKNCLRAKPLRVIFVGRLVPYKGADIALEGCIRYLKTGQLSLDIIGDGPEMQHLKGLVSRYGLEHAVKLHGWKSHDEVADHLKCANLLLFPSVREFGGGVVLEAMACGVVPIVLDYGGPGELVDDASGFRIPIGPREMIIESIDSLLGAILEGSHDLSTFSDNSVSRVQSHYSWSEKALQILSVYQWLVSPKDPPPDFGFFVSRN